MSFAHFASACGLRIKHLFPSRKIQRCGTERHHRSTNGAYFYDGERGWCMNWEEGGLVQWWNDANAKPWTEQDKKVWAEKRRAEDRAKHDGYARAAARAQKMLSECVLGPHDYFVAKHLPEVEGLIAPDGALLIPMRDHLTHKLSGLQSIWMDEADGKFHKKFLFGMKSKGAVYKIGSGFELILVEGYATGLSVHAAAKRLHLNMAVMCCFSASNMIEVAKRHGHYVMADHDASETGEKAAIQTGLPWLMPERVGMDWNDVHAADGLMSVCSALIELRKTRAVV